MKKHQYGKKYVESKPGSSGIDPIANRRNWLQIDQIMLEILTFKSDLNDMNQFYCTKIEFEIFTLDFDFIQCVFLDFFFLVDDIYFFTYLSL